MIFSSIDYLIFFIIVLFLMIVIKSKQIKKGILLVASYYFYAYWDYRFVLLMFFMSLVNYFVGIKLERSNFQHIKKRWLIISVIFNLTILGFFKYFNFFIDNANLILKNFHTQLPFLKIILPIAISFITFEIMSYIIDIYRNENKSAKSFWDLALLVAFFPHLVAGPILKPKHFLPQLNNEIKIKWENVEYGLQIFLMGMIKKIIVADNLALFVDPVFNNPYSYSALTIWLAVLAYSIQIFCDFSGYTDMAIGSAKCLGFEIPPNFNMPYISKNITEFWRRWHISLSTWLKEYLYFSLGGNRKGKIRQYINLFIVMFLGGLWHGASWNFAVWGCMHGMALAIHKFYSEHFHNKNFENLVIYKFICWLVTLLFVCTTWVFFRAQNFVISSFIIKKMYYLADPSGIKWYATSIILLLPVIIISHFVGNRMNKYVYIKLNTVYGLFIMFFILFALIFLQPTASTPFIYFQF